MGSVAIQAQNLSSHEEILIAYLLCLNADFTQADNTNLKKLERQNKARGWQAVGRLDIANSGFCSGTLIASDLVLTAAHCVYNRTTGVAYTPKDFVFRAGLREGKSAAERRIVAWLPTPVTHQWGRFQRRTSTMM